MTQLIDLTGKTFNRLTVLHKDNKRITKCGSYWICQCQCGKIVSVRSSSLRNGDIQSCGCLQKEKLIEAKKLKSEKLIGKKFGKLTVLKRSDKKSSDGALYWWCQCDCGNIVEVLGHSLKRTDGNQTVSCGCYHRSIGANNILTCLTNNNINFITEYSFIDLPNSRFDFAIIDNNQIIRLIEFDGEQHFKDVPSWGGLKLQQQRDEIKNNYCKEKNIPLIRIPYYEQENITLDLLMGNKYLI